MECKNIMTKIVLLQLALVVTFKANKIEKVTL